MRKNEKNRKNPFHPLFRNMDISSILKEHETPFYLYDMSFVAEKIRRIKRFLHPDIRLYYAVKANPNHHILKELRDRVDGLDISSGGELHRSLQAGFSPDTLSFAGPGKTEPELELAITEKIGSISIESLTELKRVEKIAARLDKKANVSLRINPVKVFKEFAIKMGGRSSQFGIDEEQCLDFFKLLEKSPHCHFVGIHVYSGTQCLKADTILDNFKNTMVIVRELMNKTNIIPARINFGGGFGVPYYENQTRLDEEYVCSEFSASFAGFKKETDLTRMQGIIELGRYLIADGGIYVARIIDMKISRGRKYCILNGGMNHHLPASGNFGQIIRKNFKMINISNPDTRHKEEVTLVGPLCTTIDILGDRIMLPKPGIGDAIAILNSGAYAYTASPLLFLSHDFPLEIMIDVKGDIHVIHEYKNQESRIRSI